MKRVMIAISLGIVSAMHGMETDQKYVVYSPQPIKQTSPLTRDQSENNIIAVDGVVYDINLLKPDIPLSFSIPPRGESPVPLLCQRRLVKRICAELCPVHFFKGDEAFFISVNADIIAFYIKANGKLADYVFYINFAQKIISLRPLSFPCVVVHDTYEDAQAEYLLCIE